jgi:DNA-binding response OmpR family regulator
VLRVHDLEIDTGARTARRSGRPVRLTRREYALLQFLAFHRGRVVSRAMIWEHVYDERAERTSNVVDVYIRYLRGKIDRGHDLPLILTRWGEGYMLRGEDEEA